MKLNNCRISHVNSGDYICCGCDTVVIPCSYYSHNKKRPYFRPKYKYKLNCELEIEIEWIKIAKTQCIATQDGFPVSYLSKLVLKDTKSLITTDSEVSPSIKSKFSSLQNHTNDIKKKNHHYTAETI